MVITSDIIACCQSVARLKVMIFSVIKFLLFMMLVSVNMILPGVNADIYKGTDAKGNVYFSDQPTEDSVEYRPNSISVVGSTKAKPEKESVVEDDNFKYTRFDIVDPVQNQVIRNESDISISLQIAPPLNVEQNHKVWLLMDGKPVVKDSQNMALQIGRVNRGAHQFQAQVKDYNGKIIARTRTVTAHVKYGSR